MSRELDSCLLIAQHQITKWFTDFLRQIRRQKDTNIAWNTHKRIINADPYTKNIKSPHKKSTRSINLYLSKHLKEDNREIIAITESQIHQFAGNMLQVKGTDDKRIRRSIARQIMKADEVNDADFTEIPSIG